jgi:hypothetical protein
MKEKVDKMKKKFPSNEVDESMDYMDENEGLEMLQDLLEMTKNKKILH